tara:strand:- start:690 stop:983 length:294 start_codon:yes stop_codon:yes gene_type:complete
MNKKYIYKKIDAPNSVRLSGSTSTIESLIITNVADESIKLSMYITRNNDKYYVSKQIEIIPNESLDVFTNGYSYDPAYTFNISLQSGSADILLILSQ